MAKLTAVDMLTRVTDKALQVHGGVGFWASSPIERVYRDARAQRFEEGTNEIQKTIIARAILAGQGSMTGFAAGKVAVITGSSRGIGRALAVRLAGEGASVVINFKRNADLAEEAVAAVQEAGGKAIAVQADMEDPAEIERALRRGARGVREARLLRRQRCGRRVQADRAAQGRTTSTARTR